MNFDWKSTLATVAPMLASAIGTPIAGIAVAKGLAAFGITPDFGNEEQQLATAMQSATPADLLALKEADQTFAIEMEKLGVEVKKLNQVDRASAREMASSKGMMPQVVLSVVYTCVYALMMYMFITGQVQVQDNQQILFGSLIGFLTAAQVQILNFWFGSSSGSKEKTTHLANK